MVTPRTIMIASLPNKMEIPSVWNSGPTPAAALLPRRNTTSDTDDDSSHLATPNPPRKRQRLDHLTLEEKILRRKLKNRVAAQSARDRKKARMDELETEIKRLRNQVHALEKEKNTLVQRNTELEVENTELKKRLGLQDIPVMIKQEKQQEVEVKEECGSQSLEHASFINGPLQQEQDRLPLSPLMMQFACLLVMSLMNCLTYYKNAAKNSWNVTLPQIKKEQVTTSQDRSIQQLNPIMPWWGPQQKNWNPSKNLSNLTTSTIENLKITALK